MRYLPFIDLALAFNTMQRTAKDISAVNREVRKPARNIGGEQESTALGLVVGVRQTVILDKWFGYVDCVRQAPQKGVDGVRSRSSGKITPTMASRDAP